MSKNSDAYEWLDGVPEEGETTTARKPGLTFTVPGNPQGKQRPRIGKVGAHARMFTPAATVAYEGLIAHAAHQAMAGAPLNQGPMRLVLSIFCPVPASWSKKKQAQAIEGSLRPTTKPDADNTLKAVCDGLNGVAWRDDVQVVDVAMRKFYSDAPRLVVSVTEVCA